MRNATVTQPEPQVYIIQNDPRKNFLPAADFGTLNEPIFSADVQIMFNPRDAVRRLKTALRRFRDDDYLLAVGDWLLVGAAQAVAAHVNHGRYRLLKWDRETNRYYEVRVDLND